MTDDLKLLGRPFCGGIGRLVVEHPFQKESQHRVSCFRCSFYFKWSATEDEAIALWNARAPAAQPPLPDAGEWVRLPADPGTCEGDDSGWVLAFLHALHAHLPEDERPTSWMQFSDVQRARIQAAYRAMIAAARQQEGVAGWRPRTEPPTDEGLFLVGGRHSDGSPWWNVRYFAARFGWEDEQGNPDFSVWQPLPHPPSGERG